MIDTTESEIISKPLHDFSVAANAVARMANTVDSVPDLLQQERQAVQTLSIKSDRKQ